MVTSIKKHLDRKTAIKDGRGRQIIIRLEEGGKLIRFRVEHSSDWYTLNMNDAFLAAVRNKVVTDKQTPKPEKDPVGDIAKYADALNKEYVPPQPITMPQDYDLPLTTRKCFAPAAVPLQPLIPPGSQTPPESRPIGITPPDVFASAKD